MAFGKVRCDSWRALPIGGYSAAFILRSSTGLTSCAFQGNLCAQNQTPANIRPLP